MISTLISTKTLGRPITKSVVTSNFIICYYFTTITIYNKNFEIVRQKQFYSQISDIAVTRDNEITVLIVLFSDKMVQMDLYFSPLVLTALRTKFIKIHLYKSICLVSNSTELAHVSLVSLPLRQGTTHIPETKYFRCVNKALTLAPLDIPTVYSVTSSETNSLSVRMYTIDNTISELDEFPLIDYPVLIKTIGQYLFIVYKHFIELRYKRDHYVISMKQIVDHGNQPDYFFPVSSEKVTNYDENRDNVIFSECEIVCLSNPNRYFLFNGSGEVYQLMVNTEATKIFDFRMEYLKTFHGFTSVTTNEEPATFIVLSSEFRDSLIIDSELEIVKILSNDHRPVSVVRSHDNSIVLYNQSTESNSLFRHTEKVSLNCIYEYLDIGILYDKIVVSKYGYLKLTSTSDEYEENYLMIDMGTMKYIDLENINSDALFDETEHVENFQVFIKNNVMTVACQNVKFGNKNLYFNLQDLPYLIQSTTDVTTIINDPTFIVDEFVYTSTNCNYCHINVFMRINSTLCIYQFNNERSDVFSEKQFTLEKLKIEDLVIFDKLPSRCLFVALVAEVIFVCSKNQQYLIFIQNGHPMFVSAELQLDSSAITSITDIQLSSDYLFVITDFKLLRFSRTFHASNNLIVDQNITEIKTENLFTHRISLKHKPSIYPTLSSQVCISNLLFLTQPKSFAYTGYFDDIFRFIPFVPKVHKTTEYGTTVTENLYELPVNDNIEILGTTKRHFIRMCHHEKEWTVVLDENEFITGATVFNDYLFVITAIIESEDKSTRGRILLLSSAYKKILAEEKVKSSLTAISIVYKSESKSYHMNDLFSDILIVVSNANQLSLYEIVDYSFVIVGITELSVLTTGVMTFKNLIITSDLFSGIHLYFLRPENPLKMTLLAKSDCLSSSMKMFKTILAKQMKDSLTDNNAYEEAVSTLVITAVSSSCSIYSINYDPYHKDSLFGNRLIKFCETCFEIPCLPVVGERVVVANRVLIDISYVYDFPLLAKVSEKIIKYIPNPCGLVVRDYLASEKIRRPETSDVAGIFKTVLLEFYYMKISAQSMLLDELSMSKTEFNQFLLSILNKC